ncbi:MAG: ADOP family duplicated permease, partial [Blastocatellia bacterium]
GYFRALGVPLTLGRDFQPSEDELHGPKVMILSEALWRRRFGGDPTVVGRQITLDAESYTVLGVMPSSFENVLAPSAELWTLLQYDTTLPADGREWGHHLSLVGRLRPGVGTDQARRELNQIAQAPLPEYTRQTGSSMSHGLIVNRLQDEVTAGVRPALLAILGAVTLLLMIACVNVTNLLLARGAERRGELAMRAALGASRTRTVRQLVTESLFLAILGGMLGMVVAEFGVGGLVALAPAELPRVNAIGLNGPVFLFAAGLTTLIGLAVGLIPALNASRANLHIGVQQASWRTAGGHQLTRRILVVVEVALALVLLVGAGLMLRSLSRLFAVSPGFNGSNLLTMQVQTYGRREPARRQFFAEALEAVRRVPGVTAAAFTAELPLGGDTGALETYAAEYERAPNSEPARAEALRYAVTPGYFETLGIPLRRGRLFNDYDNAGAAVRPVVISESYANRIWPGQDPISRRLRLGGPPGRPWDVVVGVVGDVKQASLAASQSDAVYVTTGQWLWADNTMWLVARGKGDVAALAPDIKKAVWSVDKDQPILRVATMGWLLVASAAERRFVLILFELFGAVALVLAATGIYGLLSGNVTERMREIGIRAALGATRRSIVVLVVRQGLTLTALGVAIGLVGAVSATSAIVALLFKVTRLDPITYGGVIGLLIGASAIACWVPAWRAARVEPSITLRAD